MSIKEIALYRIASWNLLLAILVVALGCVAFAQSDAPPPPPPPPSHDVMFMGPGPMGGMMHDGMEEGKLVKGVPMSGSLVVTRDTTLADGNTIHNENQTKIYRDSAGRVRREIGFELNTPATGAAKRSMIVISDPVAGYRYVLNPINKTARQMPMHPPKHGQGPPKGEPDMGPPEPRGDETARPAINKESLGPKAINGLQAEGTRVTRTIPAGQIGNAKAIEVVTERWISTDLQMPLMTTHNDPMMGTVTTKLTSITRAEPDPTLFQVPSDYKIETGKQHEPIYMPMKP